MYEGIHKAEDVMCCARFQAVQPVLENTCPEPRDGSQCSQVRLCQGLNDGIAVAISVFRAWLYTLSFYAPRSRGLIVCDVKLLLIIYLEYEHAFFEMQADAFERGHVAHRAG